jgi:hypothetical protein
MATTLMLLAAIRDVYQSHNDDMFDDIQTTYFGRRDRRTRDIVCNFAMNTTNDEVFREFVVRITPLEKIEAERSKRDTRLTNRRLLDAYVFFRKQLGSLPSQSDDSRAPTELADIEEFLAKRLATIVVTVSDEADAYTLFETLNERGVELSIFDLLKNYLFGKGDDKIEEIKRRWYEMVANLDDGGGVRFLRHYWVSRYGRIQAPRLFREIRDKTRDKRAALTLSKDLTAQASVYAALTNPDSPVWDGFEGSAESIRRNLRTLATLHAVQGFPVLLAAHTSFRPQHFERMTHLLVVLAIRYSLIGAQRTGALEIRYADLAKKITEKLVTTAAAAFRELKDMYPSDKAFGDAFAAREIHAAKHARLLLRDLEVHNGGKELEPSLDPKHLNLEHVAPVQRNHHWRNIGDLQGEDYESWIYRLGNQVLLNAKINKTIGGRSFEEKREVLSASPLVLTAEVGENRIWNTDTIAQRTKRLAALAVKCYRYDVE